MKKCGAKEADISSPDLASERKAKPGFLSFQERLGEVIK
jgi:hypothetical protein